MLATTTRPGSPTFRQQSAIPQQPAPSQLTPTIARLVNEVVQQIARQDKYSLDEYVQMLHTCPISAASVELLALRAVVSIGLYEHSNKDAQAFIRSNFESMRGNLSQVIGQLCSAFPFGFSVAEVVFSPNQQGYRNQWRLEAINVLDQRKLRFEGATGNITSVIYKGAKGDVKVPYRKCLHITNGMATCLGNDPYGVPMARRAYPFWKARSVLLSEWVIAGKNQATGLLVLQADSSDSVRLMDSQGRPLRGYDGREIVLSGVDALLQQARDLENSSMLATDLKNRVTPLQLSAGENFFQIALTYLGKMLFLSYGIPALIFDEGSAGMGSANISAGHRNILDSFVTAIVESIQNQLLENVIRPLLMWNFGITDDFGSFGVESHIDPQIALGRVSNLIGAISSGLLSMSDPDVANRLRQDLSIAPLDPDQFMAQIQAQAEQQAFQAQLAALQQGGGAAQPGAGPEPQPEAAAYP